MGSTNNLIVVPGSPAHSVLLTRLSTRDLGSLPSIQMPPLDSNLTNAAATQLNITDWINSLPANGSADRPIFNFSARNGTNLVLRGANGWPGQYFYVRSSTNLPLATHELASAADQSVRPARQLQFHQPHEAGRAKTFLPAAIALRPVPSV